MKSDGSLSIILEFSNFFQIHIALKYAGDDVTSEEQCSNFCWLDSVNITYRAWTVCVSGYQRMWKKKLVFAAESKAS